jgi:sugar phosphate isomerase/epimerase
MNTRRDFLRLSITSAAALALAEKLSAFGKRIPLGVQLYTVRSQAEADLTKTLAAIRKIGYDEVETYWNVYNRPAAQLKRMIHDAGLEVPSGHFNYWGLDGKFDYAKELGLSYVVCPMLPQKMWNSADEFRKAADQLNKWGDQAQKLDMTFAFHNHNYEFKRFGKETGYDILTKRTDPNLVKLEMDCYWITQAGLNPVEMLQKYGDRIQLLHLKDRKRGYEPSQQLGKAAEHFTEIGNGSLDFRSIVDKAQAVGTKHYFVEQDESERDPLESLAISYKNARKLLP